MKTDLWEVVPGKILIFQSLKKQSLIWDTKYKNSEIHIIHANPPKKYSKISVWSPLENLLYVALSENFLWTKNATWSHGIKCKTCSSSASSLGFLGIQHVDEQKLWGTMAFWVCRVAAFFPSVFLCLFSKKLSEICWRFTGFSWKKQKTTPKTHSPKNHGISSH